MLHYGRLVREEICRLVLNPRFCAYDIAGQNGRDYCPGFQFAPAKRDTNSCEAYQAPFYMHRMIFGSKSEKSQSRDQAVGTEPTGPRMGQE
jgi:hypothetical protein